MKSFNFFKMNVSIGVCLYILTYIVYWLENDPGSLRRPIPLISGKLG